MENCAVCLTSKGDIVKNGVEIYQHNIYHNIYTMSQKNDPGHFFTVTRAGVVGF